MNGQEGGASPSRREAASEPATLAEARHPAPPPVSSQSESSPPETPSTPPLPFRQTPTPARSAPLSPAGFFAPTQTSSATQPSAAHRYLGIHPKCSPKSCAIAVPHCTCSRADATHPAPSATALMRQSHAIAATAPFLPADKSLQIPSPIQ